MDYPGNNDTFDCLTTVSSGFRPDSSVVVVRVLVTDMLEWSEV